MATEMRMMSVAAIGFAAACGPEDAAVKTPGSSTSDAAPDATLPELYPVTAAHEFNLATTSFVDASRPGGPRTVRLALRWPKDVSGALPVVIWSHGGADGKNDPLSALDAWGEFTAREGYLSINVAHEGRTAAQRLALCTSLGIDSDGCLTFKYLNWDRPHDLRQVVDRLSDYTALLQGAVPDPLRIAVGGHSAGAGAAMMLAGATRVFVTSPVTLDDARVRSFLTFSPQGPGHDGFTMSSWANVVRPNLLATGQGDNADSVPPEVRALPHELMPAGGKYRLFIDDAAAVHTVFSHSTVACEKLTTGSRCAAFLAWLEATSLAFLDASLRNDDVARQWLASHEIEQVAAGVASWSVR